MTDYDGSDSEYWLDTGKKRMKKEIIKKINDLNLFPEGKGCQLIKLEKELNGDVNRDR